MSFPTGAALSLCGFQRGRTLGAPQRPKGDWEVFTPSRELPDTAEILSRRLSVVIAHPRVPSVRAPVVGITDSP